MGSLFQPLAVADEESLHRARMFANERRAYERLRSATLGSDLIFPSKAKSLPTPPPEQGEDADADQNTADDASKDQKRAEDYQKLREDVMMDFAAFEANVMRTQLVLNANAKERERYAAEKLRIQEEAVRVRNETMALHTHLEDSQQTLERRKGYDRLAEKITNNRMLRTREEQNANIVKLNAEIAELEQESRDYAATWSERRAQFGRIVDEGMQMLRLIKDEKEEVERREGMEEQEDNEDADGGSTRGRVSGAATPRHDDSATPLHSRVDHESSGGLLHPRGKSPARQSPKPETDQGVSPKPDVADDADMADEGEVDEDEDTEAAEKDQMDTT